MLSIDLNVPDAQKTTSQSSAEVGSVTREEFELPRIDVVGTNEKEEIKKLCLMPLPQLNKEKLELVYTVGQFDWVRFSKFQIRCSRKVRQQIQKECRLFLIMNWKDLFGKMN